MDALSTKMWTPEETTCINGETPIYLFNFCDFIGMNLCIDL